MGESIIRDSGHAQLTEKQLSMGRSKPRATAARLMYKIFAIGRAVLGAELVTRFTLNASQLFGRFAFELSSATYGEDFPNAAMALSDEILRRHVLNGATVLDVGCGYGRACRMAAKFSGSVVGIDLDETLLERARNQTAEKNVEYIHGDLTKYLGGQNFDVVLLIHVIEHIDDPDGLLQTLREITTKIIVEVPDFESDPLNLVRFDLGLQFYSDGDHVREYTQGILSDQLARNGWSLVELTKKGSAVLAVAEAI